MPRQNTKPSPVKEKSVGERLKEVRVARHLSRRELAELISPILGRGVNQQTIVKLEHGMMRASEVWLDAIGRALNVHPGVFWGVMQDERDGSVAGKVKVYSMAQLPDALAGGNVTHLDETPVPLRVQRPGLVAVRVDGEIDIDRVAPSGSVVVVDARDKRPDPDGVYLIRLGGNFHFRRYGSNPERWEPDTTRAGIRIIYPQQAVEIVGRVVHVGMTLV